MRDKSPDPAAVRAVDRQEAIRRAQALVKSRVPAGVSLVDELLAMRRGDSGVGASFDTVPLGPAQDEERL